MPMMNTHHILNLYHGSDHIVSNPAYGTGRKDNDFGSGFYTTGIKERANEWAFLYGTDRAVVNCYQLDISDLTVMNLDEYGPMSWIAEVIAHRGVSSNIAREFAGGFIKKYKIDTSGADVIIGYRADDSYGDVIEAFMSGEITVSEVKSLFLKGELGEQIFIKSEKAFSRLEFQTSYVPQSDTHAGQIISEARHEVIRFLQNRRIQIARRFLVPEISIVDALANHYVFNKELEYYERH